jgi:hypothetical protein
MASGWLGLDWGNVPAWVGTLFTSASLSLAAFTYARNSGERARERHDRERAQAAKVSWWPVSSRRLLVRNGNDVAVLLRARATRAGSVEESEQVAFGPGETRGLRLPASFESPDGGAPAIGLIIVDSYGRVWSRTPDGALDRAAGAEPAPAVSLEWEGRT